MGERAFYGARDIARASGLFLVDCEASGCVIRGGVLEIGRGATDGQIATIGVRRLLRQLGVSNESTVEAVVLSYGYDFVPDERDQILRAVS